jgi:hypothetical protein
MEPPPPEEAYGEADVILSGKVINIDLDDSGYYFEVSIQTIDVWKGDVLDEIIILTETSSDACGFNFQINNEYLIYAYSYNWGIYTNICTRTNLLEYATEDLDYLNQLSICDDGYIEIDGYCFYEDDIAVLQTLIDNSYASGIDLGCEDYPSPYCGSPNPQMDSPTDSWFWNIIDGQSYYFADGDGIVEPLELGLQEWNNSRLTSLMCGAYIYCQLSGVIPDNISDLTEIEVLRLELNYFDGEIPESVCELENVNFNDNLSFDFSYNQLCPPYPDCVPESAVNYMDTSECEDIDLGGTINIPSDYPSIQEGIDAASDGDTVLVHPGTYYGAIDFNRKNLVVGSLFILENNESFINETIIMGTDSNVSPFVQIDGISEPEVELNGFTFQDISLNTFAEGTQSYVLINIINASPKIINNRFNNFQIEGQAESAVIFCSNSSSLISNNIFSDGMIALNYELTGWILSKNSSLVIKNNLMENGYVGFSDPTGYVVSIASDNIITENTFNNVSMGYCWTCAAIVALDGSSLIINNNLILRATGDGYGAILASESEYVSYNNTLVDNRGGYANLFSDGIVNNDIIINYPNGWGNSITLDAYSTLQISYSNIEGGYEGIGNIDINPLFSNAENDDYSLQSESPCIDTGTSDLDGDGVDEIIDFYGLAPDMGAYEYEYEYDYNLGDINFDNEINILDVILMVSFILGEPTDEYELSASDINQDGLLNILDIVELIHMILNPQLSEECYIIPEVGPCDGICPTYYFNQKTNQCEIFITGCCGVEAFDLMQNCIETCQ